MTASPRLGCVWCSSRNTDAVLCYACEKLGLEVTTRGLKEIETPNGFVHPFAEKLQAKDDPLACHRCGAPGDIRLCAICESSIYPRAHG